MAKGLGAGTLGCKNTTMKYFLFIVNMIFLMGGIAVLGTSIWVATQTPSIDGSNLSYAVAVPVVGVLLGLFIVVGSLLGCFGAIRENTCMIKTFLMFVIIVMLIEAVIVVVIIVYNTHDNTRKAISNQIQVSLTECVNEDPKPACEWLPVIQNEFKCCGFIPEGADVGPNGTFVQQCYGTAAQKTKAIAAATGSCNKAILDSIDNNLALVAGVLGAVLFIEILLIIGTCLLIRGISSDNKYA